MASETEKKLIEGIAEYIYECNKGIWSGKKKYKYWVEAIPKTRAYFYKQADQILSHFKASFPALARESSVRCRDCGWLTDWYEAYKCGLYWKLNERGLKRLKDAADKRDSKYHELLLALRAY